MIYDFILQSASWDTRGSFHEHQGERPSEQEALLKWVGHTFKVCHANSIDDACQQLIDIINDETGSLFHEAVVSCIQNEGKEVLTKQFIQEWRLPKAKRNDFGVQLISHRRQVLVVTH